MEFKNKLRITPIKFAVSILVGSACVVAHADPTQSDPDDKVTKVIITGSNIKTVDTETASPVQVITRADITRQGVSTVADLIGNISGSTGGLSDLGGSNSFAPGASNVSLRNLGPQSTLVLVNGRRISSYGFADYTNVFSNVDAIPLDAVERVEILKSGASAIYGSDAVAGVINIITRTNFQGLEVNADAVKSLQSHTFGTNKASITTGFGDMNKDGYNILLNADFLKRDNVMWTNLEQYTNPDLTKTSPGFGTFSSYSTPGNIIDGPNTQPVAGCAPSLIIGGLCKYNRYQRFQAVPESERANFFSTGTFKLEGGIEAFSEISFSRNTTKYLGAFPYYGDGLAPTQWGNPSTGKSLVFNELGLAANSPLNPTGDDGVGFRYRFTDAPDYQDVTATQFRVLGGLRGNINQYEWESALGVMGSKAVQSSQGTFSSAGFIQEIGNYNNFRLNNNPNVNLAYTASDPNFFAQPGGYHPGQVNSPAVLNTLFPVYGNTGDTKAEFADAKITGPLFKVPAGMINFAAGGEIRHESMSIQPTSNLLDGDIVGYGISAADSSRNIESAYSELSIPLAKDLEMQAALRADKYPNLATHFSPKLALRYAVTDSLLLRGTYENGFRAPNLIESANSVKFAYANGTADPQRCPQASALSNSLYAQAAALPANDPQAAVLNARAESVWAQECSFGLASEVRNNPNLQPESSKSFSFGAVYEPVKGYSTSLDYWHIDRRNTIGTPSTSQLLNGGPLPAGVQINRVPFNSGGDQTFSATELTQYGVTTGPLQNMTLQMENIFQQSTSGIDIAFKGNQNLGSWGKLLEILDGTYNMTYYDTSVSTANENLTGQYDMPQMVANFTLGWDYKGFSNSLRYNYTGGYDLQYGQNDTTWSLKGCATNGFSASQCRVASARTTDYALSYSGFKNLVLKMNLLNMFQQRAPADLRAFGVGGIIPSSLQDAEGRMLRLSVDYKFY
ncbi:TonB-dependent receptor plug domain-containing protein [Solimicrobium silvestre]|uniref:TonB-dependent Receptor Plug Domain n=1 Tax=Solimicrobium silvestre TaxID=2099400 RepID=A0A2S9H0K8_9BURK|nr:TonB-dependent receptor [Solimicrobium silvestre]PRC93396.1 TonB-dependent Receptor Plug Domain [Solimicrobium silvestre]